MIPVVTKADCLVPSRLMAKAATQQADGDDLFTDAGEEGHQIGGTAQGIQGDGELGYHISSQIDKAPLFAAQTADIAVLTAGDGYSGTQDGSGEVLEGGADSGDDICQYNAGTGHTDGDTGLGHNTCADDLTIGDTHQRPEPDVANQLGFLSFS